MSTFDSFRLANLPGYARLFVALFTALMVFVCLWAVWLYTVEEGEVHPGNIPSYLESDEEPTHLESLSGEPEEEEEVELEDNLKMAHTHINGQTLLFFAIGLTFLFTSVAPRTKKIVLWVFAVSILVHVIGLSGEGYHWIFEDILAASGTAILVSIIYMAFMIFIDLVKSPATKKDESSQTA
jgi:hypothetical protein